MTAEFTGERIIPGQVETDLWNEHFARYAFAARLAGGKRVLDIGCGAGYGSAELRSAASSVVALDIAPEALQYAKQFESIRFVQASATALPFASASFDLVVCFEVIEHLLDWPALLSETARVVAPGGTLVVSTPNKSFYAETRADSGPNPFHEHEFEFAEFRDALSRDYRHVSLYLQDHVEAVGFRSAHSKIADVQVRVDSANADAVLSSFFIGVCSETPPPELPSFLYVPAAANILREKMIHIARLAQEVATKDAWIVQEQTAHRELLSRHTELDEQLRKSNRWAQDLSEQLQRANTRVLELQDELEQQHLGYEKELARLNAELEQRTKWARASEQELAACVEQLHRTEATLEERTRWAQSLDQQREALEALIAAARASRWVRLGRVAGLGPELRTRG